MKWRNGIAYNDDGSEMTSNQLSMYVRISQEYIKELSKKLSKQKYFKRHYETI